MFALGGSDDPPRRCRLVLRVGRAAGRPNAPRATGDRRRRRRPGRELRGEGVRRLHGDGRPAGEAALSERRRRAAAHVGLLRGQQGPLPGVRERDAARRRPLHRRGVPRCTGTPAARRQPHGDRRAPAPRRSRACRVAHHGRRGAHEVPRQGRERRREAGRAALSSHPTASSRFWIRFQSSGSGASAR